MLRSSSGIDREPRREHRRGGTSGPRQYTRSTTRGEAYPDRFFTPGAARTADLARLRDGDEVRLIVRCEWSGVWGALSLEQESVVGEDKRRTADRSVPSFLTPDS